MHGRIQLATGSGPFGWLPGTVESGVVPGQVGPGGAVLARWIGFGIVLLMVVVVLFVVVRYGERDRGDDGGTEIFSPGPAYGLTGTADVEEVLRIDDEGEGGGSGSDRRERGDRTGGDRAGTNDPTGKTRETRTDRRDPEGDEDADAGGRRFTHDVRERRDGEWLVEVSDGDRSARFRVGKQGSITTIDPVASPAQRHGSNWVIAAERYLRDREFAIEMERE